MTPKLSDDQGQALDAEGGAPVYVEDDNCHTTYVLLPADTFQRIRPLFEPDTFMVPDSYVLQEAVAATNGWILPGMSDYDALGASPKL